LNARERDLHQFESERNRYERAVELQKHALAELQRSLAERDEVIAEQRSTLSARDRALAQARATQDVLQQTLELRDQAIGDLRASLVARESELSNVTADRDQIRQALELREQDIVEIRSALEQRTRANVEIQSALAKRERDLTQAAAEREILQQAISFRDEMIADLRAARETQQSQTVLPDLYSSAAEAWPTPDAEPELEEFLKSSDGPEGDTETDNLYTSLELVLRGSEELIKNRQAKYLPVLEVQDTNRRHPILDVGCGRGEFLSLLRERDIRAVGVDINASDIQRLRKLGYDVHHTDGATYLETLPDASLAGITAFQVIEHLDHDYLRRMLKLAYQKLAPEGLLLLETPNPDCLTAFRYFYLDPTHVKPIPRYLLAILLRFYGFQELNVFYQNPISATVANTDADWSVYYQTYAMLGRKLDGSTSQ
jgi:SAM-dependent methyltransferase